MTTAGVATVSFIAILVGLYAAWTALAAHEMWSSSGRFSIIGALALFVWLCVHVILALIGLALLLEWLGTVAGWWGR